MFDEINVQQTEEGEIIDSGSRQQTKNLEHSVELLQNLLVQKGGNESGRINQLHDQ